MKNIEKDFFSNEKEIMYNQIDIGPDQSKFINISGIDETGFSRDSSLYQSLNNSLDYEKVKNKIFTKKELRDIENQQNYLENKINKISKPNSNNNQNAKEINRNKNLASKNSVAPPYNEKKTLNSKTNQNNLTIANKVFIYM
jgi:hypothetical protein